MAEREEWSTGSAGAGRPGPAVAVGEAGAERRADEQQLLFQAHVLSEMAEGVAAISLDGMVRFVNPALREILRLPDIEIVGLNVFELPGEPESWAARLKVGIEEALRVGAFSIEGARNRFDGSLVTIRTTYTPYRDAAGEPQGIVIVCRDATEEVEAREMLSRRAAQHQALADLSAVALRTSDFRGLCQEAARLVGHVLDADHAAVGELDGWSYTQIAAAGPATLAPGEVIDLSAFAAEIAPLRRAAPVIVDDLRPLASGAQIGVVRGSILGVPARFGERSGVVTAHHGQPNAFGETEAAFLSSVGNVLSAAADRLETLERISHSALHDPLTGLPNRTLLLDRIGQACARRDREPRGVAVIVCDVDHFKLVNDAQGHAQGDRLLRMVAGRLASSLRRSDTLAHLSSDTFAVLSEGVADPQHATVLAGRLIETIREPFALDGHRYYLTISAGIAVLEGSEEPGELLRNADAAMYRAKEHGGGRAQVFDAGVLTTAVHKLAISNDLRDAIDEGQLQLHYQPQVDLRTGRMTDVEALVRWDHPTLGLLAPDQFLEIAHQSRHLARIGQWVVRRAFTDLRRWDDVPEMAGVGVAVNLSADDLMTPTLVSDIRAQVAATGIDARRVIFEITESAAMDDPEEGIRTLTGLRSLGARIAVDDFGTGYSSMVYLRRLPLDLIKIDRQFTDGVASAGEDESIVRATLGLARSLGLACVAEGVETDLQVRALQRLGCEFAQGWRFAPAMPYDELIQLAVDHRRRGDASPFGFHLDGEGPEGGGG